MSSTGSRPGRSTGTAYGVLVVALVILLAALALQIQQPPPPAIAEFSPGAVHQIKHPPPNQAGQSGAKGGGSGRGGTGGNGPGGSGGRASARPSVPPTPGPPVAAQFTCYGSPPRQIQDPQSPPCVSFWSGDNGGATATGVTRNEITIVAPSNTYGTDIYQALETFFNQHFQFYGRRLVIKTPSTGGSNDPATQKAQADSDYAANKPFGALTYHASLGSWYRLEMARLGVVYADADGSYSPPFPTTAFGYIMDADRIFANLGEWSCKQLVNHPAAHAGSELAKTTRKFGIYMNTYVADDATNAKVLERALAACGAPVDKGDIFRNSTASADQVMTKFKSDGVTSIYCLCAQSGPSSIMSSANVLNYYPEYIFSSYGYADDPYFIKVASNPPQLEHAFGLTAQPPSAPLTDQPVYWAVNSVSPGFTWDYSDINRANLLEPYRALLLMASGIQMAGPHLTPATFAEGLKKATFPNPPFYTKPGAVGFQTGTHAMTTDTAVWWYSTTANEPVDVLTGGPGTECYVDNGRRYPLGGWPRTDANKVLFAGPCNTGSGF